jgi:hypothetical protein
MNGGAGQGGLAALGNATPFGAAAGVLSSAVSTPNTSATGDVVTGDINIGGLDFGPSKDSQIVVPLVLGGAALLVAAMAFRRK